MRTARSLLAVTLASMLAFFRFKRWL